MRFSTLVVYQKKWSKDDKTLGWPNKRFDYHFCKENANVLHIGRRHVINI